MKFIYFSSSIIVIYRLTNLIYVAPERSNTDKYRILIDLIKCARNHRCINAVSVGINQVFETYIFNEFIEINLNCFFLLG
jgi:hypothetical protein